MTTMSAPEIPDPPSQVPEPRFVLREISWDAYERMRDAHDFRHVRMTYDHGRLELMSTSQTHIEHAIRFGVFILELARGLNLRCKPLRSMTWKKPGAAGKEADECFYLANEPRIRKKTNDLTMDPPPDLAIEVEISTPLSDIESVYAAIGVPEVWRWDGRSLRILVLQHDGGYVEGDRSPSLPFLPPGQVVRLMHEGEELDDLPRWLDQVALWVRDVLAPLYQQHRQP